MDNINNITGETELKSIVSSFVGSYVERDKSVDFSNWLAERIRQEMPDMTEDTADKIVGELIEGVAAYDNRLAELNRAVENGQSKEEWLAARALEAHVGMPYDDTGTMFQEIENDLNTANARLMGEIEDTRGNIAEAAEVEIVEWNEYSLRSKALEIGQQAVMCGIGAAANIIQVNMESGESGDAGEAIGQALQIGVEAAVSEVKAVVAGGVKVAAEKGLVDILPADTPSEVIADIACVAVESAGALCDVAVGKVSVIGALERIGRAGVAAVSRLCAGALKIKLACIPYVGPLVVKLAGGLLEHMKSPKFTENVYTVVRDAARATWEGIKEKGRGIFNVLKNSVKKLLYN